MSLLIRYETVGLYLNPLSADPSYYCFKAAILPRLIQMHLS